MIEGDRLAHARGSVVRGIAGNRLAYARGSIRGGIGGKRENSGSETPFLTVKTTGETPAPQFCHGLPTLVVGPIGPTGVRFRL